MIRFAAVLFFLVAGAFAADAKNCNVPNIHLIRDVTVTGNMYVKAGKKCSIQANNSKGGTTGVEVKQRPSNGTAQAAGLRVTYTPRKGFVGKDSFTYARHSRDAGTGQPIVYFVNVQVTVEP